jgi:hypothetical protein
VSAHALPVVGELLDVLGPTIRTTNPKVISDELARLAPMLRTVGVNVQRHRTEARREITITRRQ